MTAHFVESDEELPRVKSDFALPGHPGIVALIGKAKTSYAAVNFFDDTESNIKTPKPLMVEENGHHEKVNFEERGVYTGKLAAFAFILLIAEFIYLLTRSLRRRRRQTRSGLA